VSFLEFCPADEFQCALGLEHVGSIVIVEVWMDRATDQDLPVGIELREQPDQFADFHYSTRSHAIEALAIIAASRIFLIATVWSADGGVF